LSHCGGSFDDAFLEIQNLTYKYPVQNQNTLNGVSLWFSAGQRVAIIGRNGCGKTTLLLNLNGILRPQCGRILLHGEEITYKRADLTRLRRAVGVVFQNPDEQLFNASVLQDISFGPLNLGRSRDETEKIVNEVAEVCQITDLLSRPVHALSLGQKARVALAGVLAMQPDLLIVDEVTSNLDPWMRADVMAIFNVLVEQGKTVLITTHDLHLAHTWADRVIFMEAGRVIMDGTAQTVLSELDIEK